MAHKRMFSKDITGSDAFREMPSSSQALYFHLGMEADDDGFLDSYKGVIRAISAADDDLKVLLSKRFLILFPSKIVVVKHWRINNTIRKDRYTETKHLDEKRALIVKENGAYSELATTRQPHGNQLATQKRIEEDRIEEDRTVSAKAEDVINPVITLFKEVNPSYERLYSRPPQRLAAERLLKLHGLDRLSKVIGFVSNSRADRFCPTLTPPIPLEDSWAALEGYAAKLKTNKREVIV